MAHKLGRFTNYQAELGLSQLHMLGPLAERRRANAKFIIDRLGERVPFQGADEPDVQPNPMLLVACFDDAPGMARALLSRGVDTKRGDMRDCSGLLAEPEHFEVSSRVDRDLLHIPAFPALSPIQLDRVATAVEDALDGR